MVTEYMSLIESISTTLFALYTDLRQLVLISFLTS